jgi:sugar phosphate isomerase/epimerase
MRYGVMNSPLRPLLEEVEALGQLGFDYLEVTMDAPYAHYTVIQAQQRQLRQALVRHGLALICHLPTFVSTADLTDSLREASIQETIQAMRTAAELRPLKVVLHPSIIHGLGARLRDLSERYAMAALERLLTAAGDLDLTVCVENLMPSSLSLVEPEQFDPVFKSFPFARLVLDTGHAYINGGIRRILAFIDRFPDRIGHVHASDNFGRGDDHLPIGAGSIPFPIVLEALRHIGYDDTITLEVFSPDREYLRISRDKLARMAAAAEPTKILTK